MSVEIHSDSSAARAFAQREGLGKQKHVHTRLLWIQEQVEQGRIGIKRVGTRDNEADVLTKPLAATVTKRATAANSAQDRDRQTQNWVRQRVAALEQQQRYQQLLSESGPFGRPDSQADASEVGRCGGLTGRVVDLLSKPTKEECKTSTCLAAVWRKSVSNT
eukprot:4049783-Amphidinium_carterae.1